MRIARVIPALLVILSTCGVAPAAQAAAATPADGASQARVIVKYRSDSPLLRARALTAGAPQGQRVQALGQRLGMTLSAGPAVSDRIEVVYADGVTSAALAALLALQADIEYAVPDRKVRHFVAPNDPLYQTGPPVGVGTGGPATGQWYLRAPTSEVKSGIDAEAAWDVTYGVSDIVVADIDTGVLFDHPDLKPVAQGGNLLPGYDMISDAFTANDGNGRDADAADPGDWETFEEAGNNASDSSWHGTQTSSLIGAMTSNGAGMAGLGRHVRVLPVRVLGKGGGFNSDIIAGMRWAAGLTVPGVPVNTTPARVLNMSLGAAGPCSTEYADAVAEIMARGVVVVASAGNSAGHAVSEPANCPGVIGVAALRHAGTKVGFSDLGPQIAISAPGGNCVNIGPGDACVYPIITAANTGTTAPVPAAFGGAIFTDSFNVALGTSFSSPLVAGVAALVLSAKPALTPQQVRAVLQGSVRPFPTTGAEDVTQPVIPQCAAPTGLNQTQCYCTTTTCGAGMLDAGAALRAMSGLQARIDPASVHRQQPVTFAAATSGVPAGHTIAAYTWRVVDGGGVIAGFNGAATGATVSGTATAVGAFTLGLTIVDDAGLRSSTDVTFTASNFATLDIDGDGKVSALSDGVLAMRYLFGFSGSALTAGALDPAATRTDSAAIVAYLTSIRAQLDVDGNGDQSALTDGVLLVRELFGFDNDALINGAVGPAATRGSAASVRAYVQGLSN